MFVRDSLEHDYYRWRVLAELFRDDGNRAASEGFLLEENGTVYYPPEHYEMPE